MTKIARKHFLLISITIAGFFFIFGLFTLTDYGINWDTINHLPRGQAYLNYFLTGKKDYSNLKPFFNSWQTPGQWYWQDPSTLFIKTDIPLSKVPSRSMYEFDDNNFKYFMTNDGYGHPPLSDILSSIFNIVLFQKLKIINDIDSYHVYGILLAACLSGLIFYWISKNYGKVPGFIAALSLSMYPLFWSESHFNTEKDIPETVYFSFFIFCIWKGISEKKIKWILISGIFFGLALGTKFNILFSIFILIPWFLLYSIKNRKRLISKFNIKTAITGVIAFAIGCLIFVGSWPYLWPNILGQMQKVINFYKDLGLATQVIDPKFAGPFGINIYPIFWITTTTPPIILILSIIGIVFAIKNFKKNKQLTILFLLWFIIPILRVTLPGTNIYGGVRQLMEYVPALAILSGLGSFTIISKLNKNKLLSIIFVAIVLLNLIAPIIKTHPNENVYFNFLVGGLKGAKDQDVPSWGNSFGAAYRQAAVWINKNVPKNANLTFANELIPNIPRIWLRQDINLNPANRSGYLRKGEYVIELNYEGTDTKSYFDMYLNTFLTPVYQTKVDKVAIVSVWKNDDAHLKELWIEKEVSNIVVTKRQIGLQFDLNGEYKISRLDMTYSQKKCTELAIGYFEISSDGKNWIRLPDVLPDSLTVEALGKQPKDGNFIEPFTAQRVRYINFNMTPNDTCLLKNYTSFKFYYLN